MHCARSHISQIPTTHTRSLARPALIILTASLSGSSRPNPHVTFSSNTRLRPLALFQTMTHQRQRQWQSSTLVHFPTTPLSMSSANTFPNELMTGPIYPINVNPVLRIPLLPLLYIQKIPWHFTSRWWARPLSQAQNQTTAPSPSFTLCCPLTYAEHLGPFFPPRRSSSLASSRKWISKRHCTMCKSVGACTYDFLSMIRSLLDVSPPCRSR